GGGRGQPPEQRAQAGPADDPGPVLHLVVRHVTQHFASAAPQGAERVEDALRAAGRVGRHGGRVAEHGGGGALDAGLLARVLGGQWRRGDQAGRERVELVEAGGVRRLGVQQLAERGQVARLLGERGAERRGQLLAGGRLGRGGGRVVVWEHYRRP